MKYLIFFVTFFSYSAIHMMRVALAFHFQINNMIIGIGNGLMYILVGVASLILSVKPVKRFQFLLFWTMTVCSLSFLFIPVMIFLKIRITWLYLLNLGVFGWFQSTSWPILLAIIKSYFGHRQEACMLGFWSSSKDIGNILGFLVCTIVIVEMKIGYDIALVIVGLFSLFFTIAVYNLKIDPQQQQMIQQNQTQDMCQSYRKICKDKSSIIVLIIISLLKALVYGILLWLPMYFEKSGFKQFAGIIPIGMGIMGIIGSIALGSVYQRIQSLVVRGVIMVTTSLLTIISLLIVKNIQFTTQNKIIILLLIGIIGFCVVGNLNILTANQVGLICDRLNIKVIVFSSLSIGMSLICVGLVQIAIGRSAKQDANSIFMIYFLIAVAIAILQAIRQVYTLVIERRQEQQSLLNKQAGESRNQETLIGRL